MSNEGQVLIEMSNDERFRLLTDTLETLHELMRTQIQVDKTHMPFLITDESDRKDISAGIAACCRGISSLSVAKGYITTKQLIEAKRARDAARLTSEPSLEEWVEGRIFKRFDSSGYFVLDPMADTNFVNPFLGVGSPHRYISRAEVGHIRHGRSRDFTSEARFPKGSS